MRTGDARDTLGRRQTELHIKMRENQPAGISLGNGVELMPGQDAVLPYPLAIRLIASGRADLYDPTAAVGADDGAEGEAELGAVVPENVDPQVRRRR